MRWSLDASDTGDVDEAYDRDCAYRGVNSPGLFVKWFFVCVLSVGISETDPHDSEASFIFEVRGSGSSSGSSVGGSVVRRTEQGRGGVRADSDSNTVNERSRWYAGSVAEFASTACLEGSSD